MPSIIQLTAHAVGTVLKSLVARLPPGGRSWLARTLMEDRFSEPSKAMAAFCEQAIHAWKNRQYVVEHNGEAALLPRLRPFNPSVLIDVGANLGDWTLAARKALPDATVHAFEIAETTAAELVRVIAPVADRVVVNVQGLGDREGEIALFLTPQNNTAASTVRDAAAFSMTDQNLGPVVESSGQITTGDLYMQRAGLTHIDMLKVDVEGAEFAVLRGFHDAFARGAIDLVQFEYGALNLTTREFLADYYAFFDALGYEVGKLYPEGVAFKPYEIVDEDFIGPNYIACRRARPDLIAALRCPPLRMPK